MLTRVTPIPRQGSGAAANGSANRQQAGQGTQKAGETSGHTAPNRPTTSSSTTNTAAARPQPSRSNTSTAVRHNSFMPKERVAKLNGEADNRARQAPAIEDALNKYKAAIDAEVKAKAAYMKDLKQTESDPYMTGRDWMSAGQASAEHANAWEKAAESSRSLHEALKRAMGAHN
ncbi:uncharacterized protein B0H64DRAFT_451718 [Chaetomium fimeti]|uniref:Uncharacterized protein n=1 Tax=Chaetomium fimeti TaxID=1854472 RepID=A0AAE0H7C1_9PEZI|nr:hypothetical protein B0H64DRAFT_451718 [Chaetomium fimeti]